MSNTDIKTEPATGEESNEMDKQRHGHGASKGKKGTQSQQKKEKVNKNETGESEENKKIEELEKSDNQEENKSQKGDSDEEKGLKDENQPEELAESNENGDLQNGDLENAEEGQENDDELQEAETESLAESINPEDFDSKSFLSSISDLSTKLSSENYKRIDSDFPREELSTMVHNVTTTLNNFKAYSTHSQSQLEGVREQMKEIKDRIHKKIQRDGFDPRGGKERMSLEEQELQAKLAQLNREVAKSAEELAMASELSVMAESAAIEASLVAEQAAEHARQTQAEYEARREAEIKARKAEEEKRLAEEKRREEEAKRLEEVRKAEEARRNRLKKQDDNKPPVWEKWPQFIYNSDACEFDHGIGCIVRGDPNKFREASLKCEVLDQLTTDFTYEEAEELVSMIIKIEATEEGEELQGPIQVAIPHCMPRTIASTREPVIKARVEGKWVELKTQETTFENHKDVKFVQAEVNEFTSLAVVTRFKRDYLQFSKRGGRVVSSVDSRVTFEAERGTFDTKEPFVVQLQPIDSASLSEIRKTSECKGLLTSSAIVSTEWLSKEFKYSVSMTLPCPPNPVKARKAAAMKKAKEAKMKNPQSSIRDHNDQGDEKRSKKKKVDHRALLAQEEEEERKAKAPKWYMGIYGNNDEDETDRLFLLTRLPSGRWVVLEDVIINQVKLDLVQFRMSIPLHKFVVIRTRTNVEATEALTMAKTIQSLLNRRVVRSILKQKTDDPNDVVIQIVPKAQADRVLKKLEDDGYEDGPGASADQYLQEGDLIEICSRGNIKSDTNVEVIYNSHMPPNKSLFVEEVDRYLQKSYPMYRGFIQLVKKIKIVHQPTWREKEEDENAEPRIEWKEELICEHLVSIPKEVSTPPPVKKAPIQLTNREDSIDEKTLHQLATDLGDEWQKLAHYLNVKRVRIQAIIRNLNNETATDEDAKYDMLINWTKKLPRSLDKATILINALYKSGRPDLAERIDDQNKEFKKQRKFVFQGVDE